MSGALVLFTRDLRVRDQPALAAAVREFDVSCRRSCSTASCCAGRCGAPNRLAFLRDCLRDLDSSLRAARRAAAAAPRRRSRAGAEARRASRQLAGDLHERRRHTLRPPTRTQRLRGACARARDRAAHVSRHHRRPPGELTPTGGDHYRVFTPYWRVWSAQRARPPRCTPRGASTPPRSAALPPPTLASLTRRAVPDLPAGGETRRARAPRALGRRGTLATTPAPRRSRRRRDLAAQPLPALRLPLRAHRARALRRRQAAAARRSRASSAGATSTTRCSPPGRTSRMPTTARAGIAGATDPQALDAWQEGLTGYPIVDAGMRQLAQEGFMHNRARLIVASLPHQDAVHRLAPRRRALRHPAPATPTSRTTSATGSGWPARATTPGPTACSTRCARRTASTRTAIRAPLRSRAGRHRGRRRARTVAAARRAPIQLSLPCADRRPRSCAAASCAPAATARRARPRRARTRRPAGPAPPRTSRSGCR